MLKRLLAKISLDTIPTFKIILIGVVIRLIVSLFLTLIYDSFSIFMWSKSVADTGSILYGFVHTPGVQIYGKIYFQMIALWMIYLSKLHLLDLRYLFDFKPFQPNGFGYMAGYPLIGPELYQIVLLKLLQFVFDFVLLAFLVGLVRIIQPKRTKEVILFWALNPLFIYVGYVFFQADMAMTAALTGGVYFAVKAIQNPSVKWKLLSLFFLAAGAMIKQVPILLVPFALIIFADSIVQFILYGLWFGLFYILFYQPWSVDAILLKKFFLVTPESTAMLGTGVFGFSLFFTLYLALFAVVLFAKQKITSKPVYFVHVSALVLAILYLSEDPGMMLVQFNMWITPLLAILAAYNSVYALFLFAPLIGFFKRILDDSSLLSGALSISLGQSLMSVFRYEFIIDQFIRKDLLSKLMSTMMSMSYLLLGVQLVFETFRKQTFSLIKRIQETIPLNLAQVSLIIFAIFWLVFFGEYTFMSHYARLTTYDLPNATKYRLNKPILFSIQNTKQHAITGINILVQSGTPLYDDNLVIQIKDKDTGNILTTAKTSNFLLPQGTADYYTIFLPKAVSAKHMLASVYEEKGLNETYVFADSQQEQIQKPEYPQYDNYFATNPVTISFAKKAIDVNIRGQYTAADELGTLLKHIRTKPKFYYPYFGFITLLLIVILFPFGILGIKLRGKHAA